MSSPTLLRLERFRAGLPYEVKARKPKAAKPKAPSKPKPKPKPRPKAPPKPRVIEVAPLAPIAQHRPDDVLSLDEVANVFRMSKGKGRRRLALLRLLTLEEKTGVELVSSRAALEATIPALAGRTREETLRDAKRSLDEVRVTLATLGSQADAEGGR